MLQTSSSYMAMKTCFFFSVFMKFSPGQPQKECRAVLKAFGFIIYIILHRAPYTGPYPAAAACLTGCRGQRQSRPQKQDTDGL